MWFASVKADFSDKEFKHGPFKTAQEAAENAVQELAVIEYGIDFDKSCFRED